MVNPLSYFSFHPMCSTTGVTKAVRGMYYHVCGMMQIKETLLLVRKRCPCSGGSGFPVSLSDGHLP